MFQKSIGVDISESINDIEAVKESASTETKPKAELKKELKTEKK